MTNKQRKIERLKTQYKIKKTQNEIYQVTPEIYAAFGIALHEKGWSYEQTSELFDRTQEIWSEYVQNGTSEHMADDCLELTGIDVIGKVSE